MMLHEIAPEKYHVEYRNKQPGKRDKVLLYTENELIVRSGEALDYPGAEEVGNARYRYLFSIGETAYFSVLDEKEAEALSVRLVTEHPGNEESAPEFLRLPERGVRYLSPRSNAYAGAVGAQLIGWYRRSRFCGRCGAKTIHSETERMMYCPKCGNMIYPEIHPSVIVGIFHEDRLLVTRYNPKHMEVSNGHLFKAPVHEALVAGYIETGETAEEAVEREVMEEVGLKVKNIRFYRDTPWPFSGSLLFSFLCDVDGDPTIRIEEDELSMAVFRRRSEMPDRSKEVSLTSAIMEDFRLGRL